MTDSRLVRNYKPSIGNTYYVQDIYKTGLKKLVGKTLQKLLEAWCLSSGYMPTVKGREIRSLRPEDAIDFGVEMLLQKRRFPNLRQITEQYFRHLSSRQKDILHQLFSLRMLEERFENGTIDEETPVTTLLLNTPWVPLYGPTQEVVSGTPVSSVYETEQNRRYYIAGLNQLDKTVCVLILRAFIRYLDPDKETSHAYCNGDRSKPKWWPSCIRHERPCWLEKQEVIEVTLHILCGLYTHGVRVGHLVNALQFSRARIKTDDFKVILEIVSIRALEEAFLMNNIDPRSPVYLRYISIASHTSLGPFPQTNAGSQALGLSRSAASTETRPVYPTPTVSTKIEHQHPPLNYHNPVPKWIQDRVLPLPGHMQSTVAPSKRFKYV
ncbi:hypothetical protein BDV33DRAFT_185092 [Aspergillus novoparasiticus]|uniref:Subtelomeric hrmA-associated cluster protein AFUB-079030/YDR124W-like helical bundle domain-containing protein n=1 Tax=Aspergillus novoparasiticus TaxID=986946 RepID=A0A5N6E6S9_9EURO|nr:hypothetical protein BDV33DRAFT_185092 [Aspergillus novoparasiticus]